MTSPFDTSLSDSGVPLAGPVASAVPAAAAAVTPTATPVLKDPIAEAPNAVWYVRPPSGGQYGPAEGAVMRRWIVEGRVSADSLVWREGWPEWRNASDEFPELTGGLPPAPISVPPAPAPISVGNGTSPSPTSSFKPRARRGNSGMGVAIVVTLGLLVVVLGIILVVLLTSSNRRRDSEQKTSYVSASSALKGTMPP
jgi:hypothetical protein